MSLRIQVVSFFEIALPATFHSILMDRKCHPDPFSSTNQ